MPTFQTPGVAEAQLEADLDHTFDAMLRRVRVSLAEFRTLPDDIQALPIGLFLGDPQLFGAPLVDVASTTQGSNFSAKVIDKLPVGRNYADVVFTQPGVQADFGETQGRSLAISIYGSTSSENLFLIDGVNTTNVIKGFQGKDINNEFIQEVEVKTGGYQAEYGRNTGGVVNVITKSGGNEFHGGVFGYYNDTGMRADIKIPQTPDFSETGDAAQTAIGPNTFLSKDNRQEYGADLGGFMLKDKIWFFGAYDRVTINQDEAQRLLIDS